MEGKVDVLAKESPLLRGGISERRRHSNLGLDLFEAQVQVQVDKRQDAVASQISKCLDAS